MGRDQRHSWLATTGRTLLAAAAVVLLFVGYQLWGTGIVQSRQQASLQRQFERSLAGRRATGAPPTAGGSHPGTPTTAAPMTDPSPGRPVGTLVIPKIGVDQVVVEGIGPAQLAVGPGHYPGTPLPGQAGNAGIAGHRTTHGRPFYDLQALAVGDRMTVTTLQGAFRYSVIRSEVVAPGDLSVLAPSSVPELTLTTCTPRYSAAQRLVVVGRLVAPSGPAASSPVRPAVAVAGTTATDPLLRPADWLWLGVWGLACLALAAAVVATRRRLAWRLRWVAPAVAAPVALVLLFFFFGAVNTMLPASF